MIWNVVCVSVTAQSGLGPNLRGNSRAVPKEQSTTSQLVIQPQPSTAPSPTKQPSSSSQSPMQMPVNQQAQLAPVTAQTIANDLQGSIQRLLAINERRRPNLPDCLPGTVLAYCVPYGSQAMVTTQTRENPAIYAVGAICWNIPCQGKTLFQISGDRVIARVGENYQSVPGEFLAMLAFSEIAPNYEIKAGSTSRTLEHLINTEKRNCSRGQNQSLVLAGLSFYTSPDEHWKNSLGEDWTLERLVYEELSRRADQSSADVTNQLLGLSAAVQKYQLSKRPLPGSFAGAVTHLETYQRFALSVQNHDGTWHPLFFVSKGASPDSDSVFYATAHIMRALVYSLPQEQLNDPQIHRGISILATLISQRTVSYSQGSDKQIRGMTVGLHALSIYSQRVYGQTLLVP
ncbi:MAG: hypothetical protein LBJ67_10455 [Planctomycetaceae bacterium]|nr:hypothetical protein [Planctomycetaceae bacterium]